MSRFLALLASCLASAVAAAASMAPPPAPTPGAAAAAPATRLSEEQKARMALDRLAFGARPGDVARVRKMGVDAWIQQQLNPERIPDAQAEGRVAGLSVTKQSTAQLFYNYRSPAVEMRRSGESKELSQEEKKRLRRETARDLRAKGYHGARDVYAELATDRLLRATYSERQLQEVMVDFWSNHFNVYARKPFVQWYLPAYDRDVIRPHALGRFRDLLLATAHSPAMLLYLDNYRSVSPPTGNAARARAPAQQRRAGINENYARELMELHTLGVDGGYAQQDVKEVARAFTGWTIADPRGGRVAGAGMKERGRPRPGEPAGLQSGDFYFNARLHDPNGKLVLGQRIDAGGEADGIAVIDLLARHPSTARFIAGKLCERFASDTPDPAMVARVAAAFTRSDGDIRATLSALFRDPAFFTSANYRAKVKTPFELVASSLRALGAQSNGREVQFLLADLGQPLYGFQAPTGYSEVAADWVNAGALVKRMNFAVALAANRIPGTQVDLVALGESSDARAQLEAGLLNLLGGQASESTERGLVARLHEPLPEAQPPAMQGVGGAGSIQGMDAPMRLLAGSGDPQRVQVAALILGSPEFQRQ